VGDSLTFSLIANKRWASTRVASSRKLKKLTKGVIFIKKGGSDWHRPATPHPELPVLRGCCWIYSSCVCVTIKPKAAAAVPPNALAPCQRTASVYTSPSRTRGTINVGCSTKSLPSSGVSVLEDQTRLCHPVRGMAPSCCLRQSAQF
jgi:hypothetical protein